MSFKVSSDIFSSATSWVTQGSVGKDFFPVIIEFLSNKQAKIFTFDSDQYSKADIIISTNDDIDGKRIVMDGQFVKNLSKVIKGYGEDIEFTEEKGRLLAKTSGGNTFHIPILTINVAEDPKKVVLGDVPEAEFFEIITKIAKISDQSSGKPIANSVGFIFDTDSDDNSVIGIATDMFAFSEVLIPFTPAKNAESKKNLGKSFSLPAQKALAVSPNSKSTGSLVSIITDEQGRFGYEFADGRVCLFSTRSHEVSRGPSEQMRKVSKNSNQKADVVKKDFEKAISDISMLVPDEITIKLVIKDGEMKISDIGDLNSTIVSANMTDVDQDVSITFNRSVLKKALIPVTTGSMSLKWNKDNPKHMNIVCIDGEGKDVEEIFIICIANTK